VQAVTPNHSFNRTRYGMTAHPNNRPHRADSETSNFLFTLYTLLFEANIELRIKQRTFETAAESKNSWRVVSISQDALNHISLHKNTKGLQRGHILSRSTRAQYLFNRNTPLAKSELLDYFFEHDTVALVTKTENSKDGTTHWSPLHEVPTDLFTAGTFSIYARKGKELVWVDQFLNRGAA
jgi:hypothetical protein